MNTRRFYLQSEVCHGYDLQRFGGKSGTRVNEREVALVSAMLPPDGRILDLACGTGRLTHQLAARGYGVVPVDSSLAMLRETVAGVPAGAAVPGVVLADAFRLPCGNHVFDGIAAMRLLF